MLRLRRLLRRLESTLHLSAVDWTSSFSFGLNSFCFFILFLLIADLQIDCLDSIFTLLPCIGDMSVLTPAPKKYSKKRPEKKALKFSPPIRNKIFMDAIVSSISAPLSFSNLFQKLSTNFTTFRLSVLHGKFSRWRLIVSVSHWSTNQSINQSINRSINRTIDRSIN